MIFPSDPHIDLPIEKLSLRQKIDLHAYLREELGFDWNIEPPDWHGEVLAEREAKVQRGESKFDDLDEAFERIRSQCL